MNTIITYEFPLHERIRIFIRLQQLFQQFDHFSAGETVADKRAAINILLDIMMIFKRNDLRSEVLKQLDYDSKTFDIIAENPAIDSQKLEGILTEIAGMKAKFYTVTEKIGKNIMQSDLFQSIMQRNAIPGGSCSFDLPEYHYWLEQDETVRARDLRLWSEPFNDTRIAIDLILDFIRHSDTSNPKIAESGFFQINLDRNLPYQLVRIDIAQSCACFAEISGGKHRCSIRFMVPSTDNNRPLQSHHDIAFSLSCCLF